MSLGFCCEIEENCCEDYSMELVVRRNDSGIYYPVYQKTFYYPNSFVFSIPAEVFSNCGLYEFRSTVNYCGNKQIRTLTRYFGERPVTLTIVPITNNCCECVNVGDNIVLTISGNFPSDRSQNRTGKWKVFLNSKLILETRPTVNITTPLRLKILEEGKYKIEYEYKDKCNNIYTQQIQFSTLKDAKFKKLECNKYLLVNNCSNSEYKKDYKIVQYKNDNLVLINEVKEGEDKIITLESGIYKIQYYSNENTVVENIFTNYCELNECLEKILDAYLCEEACSEKRKDIERYYHQTAFLWNYLLRLNPNLNEDLEDYCKDNEYRYYIISDIIDKLTKICNTCFKVIKIQNCGCGESKIFAKRTLKQ